MFICLRTDERNLVIEVASEDIARAFGGCILGVYFWDDICFKTAITFEQVNKIVLSWGFDDITGAFSEDDIMWIRNLRNTENENHLKENLEFYSKQYVKEKLMKYIETL